MYQNIYTSAKNNSVVIWDDEKGMVEFEYEAYAYKKSATGDYTTMQGDRVEKTTKFRRGDPNFFETDVAMDTRTLIDIYGDDDTPSKNHCVFNFDIEAARGIDGYSPPEVAGEAITSVAFKDSLSNIRRVYVLDEENRVIDAEDSDDIGPFVVRRFDDEEDMLTAFLEEYIRIKPTIMTGWNIWGYDIPYLYNRLTNVLGRKAAKSLSPIGIAYISDKNQDGTFDCTIAGVSCLDLLPLYKQFTYTELSNYRLGTVGMKEVKMDKVEYDGDLNHLFATDIKKFIQYNLTDVDIVDAIDEKMQLIELTRGICHICHVPYTAIKFSSRFLEGALLTYLRRKNIVADNKPKKIDQDENEVGFVGAFVKQPIPGLYEWIFSNDLASLYPSIIRSLNISPETKIGKLFSHIEPAAPKAGGKKGEMIPAHPSWDPVKFGSGEMKLVYNTEQDCWDQANGKSASDLKASLVKNNWAISASGVIYSQDTRGIIPEILDKWYAERKEYKQKMFEASDNGDKELEAYYDMRQLIQKVFLNSLYGVLGLNGWRWYDLDNALSVTATGQDIIKATANCGNEVYADLMIKAGAKKEDVDGVDYVTYVDTDSNYLSNKPLVDQMGLDDDERCKNLTIKTSNHLVEKINEYYDRLMLDSYNSTNHFIETEGETVGRRAIWIAKKRYAIHKIYDLEKKKDTDKFHIKGLDVVRSSFPTKFRNFMLDERGDKPEGIIADFLFDAEKSIIDDKILKLRKEIGSFPVEEIARNTGVKNISRFEEYCIQHECLMGRFPKVKDEDGKTVSFPAHVKAAINFNSFIRHQGLDIKTEPITNGEKIKYVYLKRNEFGLEEIAFRGYQDPQKLLDFIDKYADGTALYEKELSKKLDDFYDAAKWDYPSDGAKVIDEFFSF